MPSTTWTGRLLSLEETICHPERYVESVDKEEWIEGLNLALLPVLQSLAEVLDCHGWYSWETFNAHGSLTILAAVRRSLPWATRDRISPECRSRPRRPWGRQRKNVPTHFFCKDRLFVLLASFPSYLPRSKLGTVQNELSHLLWLIRLHDLLDVAPSCISTAQVCRVT